MLLRFDSVYGPFLLRRGVLSFETELVVDAHTIHRGKHGQMCSRSILTARAGRLHHHARLTNIFITYACAENDDSYVLRADLPGMKKEDVNVELDGQIVRISATKKDTKKWEEEGYKYHRAERRDTMEYSQRALRRPANTDFSKLEAGFDDGTLTVTFGKQKASTPTAKQITIQ